jgi:hypothetical protein
MISGKGKKIMSLKIDFSLRPKTISTHQGSTVIRIGPRSENSVTQPSSTRKGE